MSLSIFESAERILLWWKSGAISGALVTRWADRELETAEEIPDWLIELSTQSVSDYLSQAGREDPRPGEGTYTTDFLWRVETHDPDDPKQVLSFAEWAMQAAIGEPRTGVGVQEGYQLDDLFNDAGDPEAGMALAREILQRYRENHTALRTFLDQMSGE